MRKMTYQVYMGLTKMAGTNCFAAADFLALVATLLGDLMLKKPRGGSLSSLLCKVVEGT